MKPFSRILFWLIATPIVFMVYKIYMYYFRWDNFYYLISAVPKRPYVYRILAPFIIKALVFVAPNLLMLHVHIVIFVSFIGFMISIRAMASMYWNDAKLEFITCLSVLALLPLMFENEHIYDIPTLFFFTLAFAFMQRERWKAFLTVFILASLNKETSILLTVAFLAIYWGRRDRTFWILNIAQLGIYSVIRTAIMLAFLKNPGEIMEFHINEHIKVLWTNPIGTLIALTFFWLVLYYANKGIKTAPLFLRRAFVILLPLYVLYLIGGAPFELRVFYEAFPIIFLLCMCAILKPDAPSVNTAKLERNAIW
jgi:hypothetical protein